MNTSDYAETPDSGTAVPGSSAPTEVVMTPVQTFANQAIQRSFTREELITCAKRSIDELYEDCPKEERMKPLGLLVNFISELFEDLENGK